MATQFTRIPELFGVKTVQLLAGDDLATKLACAREAVEYCRAGNGPVFCELQSVHWPGSNMVFAQMLTGMLDLGMAWGEREPQGEHAGWLRDHDPVLRMAREFIAAGLMSKDELLALDRKVCGEVERAAQFAIDSALPDPKSAYDHVFA